MTVAFAKQMFLLHLKGVFFFKKKKTKQKQGGFRNIPTGLSGTVENVDPSQTHRVRMRTIMSHTCQVTERRSEWSHVVGRCQLVLINI